MVAGLLVACTTGQEKVAELTAKAEQGDVKAMVEIAEMYCGGTAVAQDDQICGMWMKRAAENGHARAQYLLGRMYESGIGMRADPEQAYKWYALSASQGYQAARTGAQQIWADMTPQQREQAEKMTR